MFGRRKEKAASKSDEDAQTDDRTVLDAVRGRFKVVESLLR
jgi:hypothetical protein